MNDIHEIPGPLIVSQRTRRSASGGRNRRNERREDGRRWIRWSFGIALAFSALLLVACGDDDDNGNDVGDSPEEVVDRIEEAVVQPGMVFHAAGDDGSEVWLDPENQRYRRKEASRDGGLTSIGEGWTRYRYDTFTNEVITEDLSPEGLQPRIEDPAVAWFEPLTALGYGSELELIGLTTADGRQVVALEARSPVGEPGEPAVSFLEGRVEVDAVTYLPTAFERRQTGITPTPGLVEPEEPEPARIRYTSQLVPVSDVPEGFFDRSVVEEDVKTLGENIAQARSLGLTPYWLGEQYAGPGGLLTLPETDNLIVDITDPSAELHYGLVVRTVNEQGEVLPDTVVVRMSQDLSSFVPPQIEAFAGDLPESRTEVTVRGVPAVLLTSRLTPSDLPCPEGNCPPSDVPLYVRLAFTLGETSFQIEALARIGTTGQDLNGYNSEEGIIHLAEALQEAEAPPEE